VFLLDSGMLYTVLLQLYSYAQGDLLGHILFTILPVKHVKKRSTNCSYHLIQQFQTMLSDETIDIN
jgi:hypothetical protein